MLKPFICAICEKVIFDQQIGLPPNPNGPKLGPPSLIALFSKLYVTIPHGVVVGTPAFPPNALAPRDWSIYTEWDTEPGDETRHYVLRAQVFYPDGATFGGCPDIPINVEPNSRSQAIVRIPAFPIGQSGTYIARVWVEENHIEVVKPIDLKIDVIFIEQPLIP